MLTEGVPPAMIENVGRMAGMPVGPLSLNDEVAIDLGLKIVQGDEDRRSDRRRSIRSRRSCSSDLVEKRRPLGRKNKKGFYDYPEGGRSGSGRGSRTCSRRSSIPTRRLRGAEASPARHAGARGGAHGRGRRHHRSARGRCRLDPRLRLRAVHRRRLSLHRLHGREALRRAVRASSQAKHGDALRARTSSSCDMAKSGGTFYGAGEARRAA